MTSLTHTAPVHARHSRRFTDIAADFFRHLILCFDVAQQRRRLSQMDARQLMDIGLTRTDAEKEIRRGFFDVSVDQLGQR